MLILCSTCPNRHASFRLVKQIEAEEQTILDEFGIGFELHVKRVIYDLSAARLVSAEEFRLNRAASEERHGSDRHNQHRSVKWEPQQRADLFLVCW